MTNCCISKAAYRKDFEKIALYHFINGESNMMSVFVYKTGVNEPCLSTMMRDATKKSLSPVLLCNVSGNPFQFFSVAVLKLQ